MARDGPSKPAAMPDAMEWQYFILAALTGLFSFAGAFIAVRAELRSIRRDVDGNSRAIGKAHERIDQILARD